MYHCTPQEFDKIPIERIIADLTCMGIEGMVRAREAEDAQLFGK